MSFKQSGFINVMSDLTERIKYYKRDKELTNKGLTNGDKTVIKRYTECEIKKIFNDSYIMTQSKKMNLFNI